MRSLEIRKLENLTTYMSEFRVRRIILTRCQDSINEDICGQEIRKNP
jgi:hypothetical protein